MLAFLALGTVAAGLFFKVAAVPFHQWAPDVYEGAPTPITAYVSVASKTASFALLLRLFLTRFLAGASGLGERSWSGGGASLTRREPRGHHADQRQAPAGVLLDLARGLHSAGIGGGGERGRHADERGLQGMAFYLFVYAFMNIGAFAVVIVLRRKGLSATSLTI